MRSRWRSRGDGPDGCIRRTAASAEDGGSRACCCARNAAQPQGKMVGGAVAGQGRAGARPAEKRGRIGASLASSAENDAGGRHIFSAFGAGDVSALPLLRPPCLPIQRHAPRPTRHRPCRARCRVQDRVDWRQYRFRRGPVPIRPVLPSPRARTRSAHPVL